VEEPTKSRWTCRKAPVDKANDVSKPLLIVHLRNPEENCELSVHPTRNKNPPNGETGFIERHRHKREGPVKLGIFK